MMFPERVGSLSGVGLGASLSKYSVINYVGVVFNIWLECGPPCHNVTTRGSGNQLRCSAETMCWQCCADTSHQPLTHHVVHNTSQYKELCHYSNINPFRVFVNKNCYAIILCLEKYLNQRFNYNVTDDVWYVSLG